VTGAGFRDKQAWRHVTPPSEATHHAILSSPITPKMEFLLNPSLPQHQITEYRFQPGPEIPWWQDLASASKVVCVVCHFLIF